MVWISESFVKEIGFAAGGPGLAAEGVLGPIPARPGHSCMCYRTTVVQSRAPRFELTWRMAARPCREVVLMSGLRVHRLKNLKIKPHFQKYGPVLKTGTISS